jgi:hypothetical protein
MHYIFDIIEYNCLPTLILCEKLSFFTPKINILEGNIKFGKWHKKITNFRKHNI